MFKNTRCVKISRPNLTRYNFDKRSPIFIFFSLSSSKRICGVRWN